MAIIKGKTETTTTTAKFDWKSITHLTVPPPNQHYNHQYFNLDLGALNLKPVDYTYVVPPPSMWDSLDSAIAIATKPKPEKTSDTIEKTLGQQYKYDKLSNYVGLEGKIPIRAGTTFIGVEVELEKVKYKDIPSGVWKIHEEGSLKVNGQEFVTIPIQFKYLEVEIKRLFKGITSCDPSIRCSTHVHINARDFTLKELTAFIILYMIFEKSMFNFSGSRVKSNFCVPLYAACDSIRPLVSKLKDDVLHKVWYKYLAFNLCPIWGQDGSKKIGTVEFRHMVGTTDVKYILNWINLIVSLKISAKKMPLPILYEYLETMNTTSGYTWLAQAVFKDFSELITAQPTFKSDVEFCITSTKNMFIKKKEAAERMSIIIKKGK